MHSIWQFPLSISLPSYCHLHMGCWAVALDLAPIIQQLNFTVCISEADCAGSWDRTSTTKIALILLTPPTIVSYRAPGTHNLFTMPMVISIPWLYSLLASVIGTWRTVLGCLLQLGEYRLLFSLVLLSYFPPLLTKLFQEFGGRMIPQIQSSGSL